MEDYIVWALRTLIATVLLLILWNWLMPLIFGLITINFWQAFGLYVLSRLLFESYSKSPKRIE